MSASSEDSFEQIQQKQKQTLATVQQHFTEFQWMKRILELMEFTQKKHRKKMTSILALKAFVSETSSLSSSFTTRSSSEDSSESSCSDLSVMMEASLLLKEKEAKGAHLILELAVLCALKERIDCPKYIYVVQAESERCWNSALALSVFFDLQPRHPFVKCIPFLCRNLRSLAVKTSPLNAELRMLNENIRRTFNLNQAPPADTLAPF